jgi:enoyl-CoA hydratase
MTVHVEWGDLVVLVTLDRPERRNAVDHDTVLALIDVQREVAEAGPGGARVVVLTGAAPAFSAGADLTGVEEGRFAIDLGHALRGFGELDVPVIAAIDGPALGAGAQLVAAADLRVASPDSRIGVPAARLGLVVDHWTVRRMVSEFTAPVARAMLVAAEEYRGDRLHQIGAVHRLGELADALEWASRIAQLAPLTLRGHKLALERLGPPTVVDELVEAARAAAWSSADAAEGRQAFLDKRRPDFSGS